MLSADPLPRRSRSLSAPLVPLQELSVHALLTARAAGAAVAASSDAATSTTNTLRICAPPAKGRGDRPAMSHDTTKYGRVKGAAQISSISLLGRLCAATALRDGRIHSPYSSPPRVTFVPQPARR